MDNQSDGLMLLGGLRGVFGGNIVIIMIRMMSKTVKNPGCNKAELSFTIVYMNIYFFFFFASLFHNIFLCLLYFLL